MLKTPTQIIHDPEPVPSKFNHTNSINAYKCYAPFVFRSSRCTFHKKSVQSSRRDSCIRWFSTATFQRPTLSPSSGFSRRITALMMETKSVFSIMW